MTLSPIKIILSTHVTDVADLLKKSFKYHYLEMMVTNLFNVLRVKHRYYCLAF